MISKLFSVDWRINDVPSIPLQSSEFTVVVKTQIFLLLIFSDASVVAIITGDTQSRLYERAMHPSVLVHCVGCEGARAYSSWEI